MGSHLGFTPAAVCIQAGVALHGVTRVYPRGCVYSGPGCDAFLAEGACEHEGHTETR